MTMKAKRHAQGLKNFTLLVLKFNDGAINQVMQANSKAKKR
jgi:hypothetical protein